MQNLQQHLPKLVAQAQLVSQELIRHEMWHEALEEASRLYFGDHNVEVRVLPAFLVFPLKDFGFIYDLVLQNAPSFFSCFPSAPFLSNLV